MKTLNLKFKIKNSKMELASVRQKLFPGLFVLPFEL